MSDTEEKELMLFLHELVGKTVTYQVPGRNFFIRCLVNDYIIVEGEARVKISPLNGDGEMFVPLHYIEK